MGISLVAPAMAASQLHPAGDDDVDPAQQCRGQRGAGLPIGEPIALAGGQMPVAGGQHRVMREGAPCRAPGGQPQPGPASPGDLRPALEVPLLLSRGQSPACLTNARGLSKRVGSPISANIAAAPTALTPGMLVTNSVSPSSSSTSTMRDSTWARGGFRRAPTEKHIAGAFQRPGALGHHSSRVDQGGKDRGDDGGAAAEIHPTAQAREPPRPQTVPDPAVSTVPGDRCSARAPPPGRRTSSGLNGSAAASSTPGQAHSSRSRSCWKCRRWIQ